MLRPYQQSVFNDIADSVRNGHKGVLACLPCRSGKSYIMSEICRTARGNVLILAHRHQLLNQHRELFKQQGIKNARLVSVFTEVNHLGEHGSVDMIIIDEAHLSGAKSYQKVCEYYNCLTIGFTATPCRLDGKPLTLFDDLVVGISADELIQMGNIAQYDYYAPDIGIDTDNVSVVAGEYNSKELSAVMLEPKIYGDVIKYYRELADGKQAIAYCTGIKHATDTAVKFNSAGIPATNIDSSMPQYVRDTELQRFRNGEVTILCNANLISEGITLPEADVVLMLRPTMSVALFIQQACRCLTPRQGKRAVIIDYVNNVQRHGLPTETRQWSLTETQTVRKQHNDDGTLSIRQCINCYRTFKTAPKCPYCGYEYTATAKELKTMETAKLKLIQAEQLAAERESKKYKRMEVGQARTLADLIKIGKERGYSNPYAWANFVMRGRKS